MDTSNNIFYIGHCNLLLNMLKFEWVRKKLKLIFYDDSFFMLRYDKDTKVAWVIKKQNYNNLVRLNKQKTRK